MKMPLDECGSLWMSGMHKQEATAKKKYEEAIAEINAHDCIIVEEELDGNSYYVSYIEGKGVIHIIEEYEEGL